MQSDSPAGESGRGPISRRAPDPRATGFYASWRTMGLVLLLAAVLVGLSLSGRGLPPVHKASSVAAAELSGDQQQRIRPLRTAGEESAVLAKAPSSKSPNLVDDPEVIEAGRRTYSIHCWACHGHDGGGGIGPNLRDSQQLYGEGYEDILNSIANGIPGKPMNAWKDKLSPQDIRDVAAFVFSLKGTRPDQKPSGKRYTLM